MSSIRPVPAPAFRSKPFTIDRLFPPDDKPIVIRQAETVESCYYLAFMDCLFQTLEGRRLFKNKFFFRADGRLAVRFSRNSHSINLIHPVTLASMSGKYELDQKNPSEDIFIIKNKKLESLIFDDKDVRTDCAALKIVEHLITYYFNVPSVIAGSPGAPPIDPSASIHRHNIYIPEGRISYDCSNNMEVFIAELLGMRTYRLNIETLRLLKTIRPQAPIYVAMFYGEPDASGTFHLGHAYRLEKIVPNGRGSDNYVLINPHNNSKREVCSDAEFRKRLIRASYSPPAGTEDIQLIKCVLSRCQPEDAQYVCAHPILFQSLVPLKRSRKKMSSLEVLLLSAEIHVYVLKHKKDVLHAKAIIEANKARIETLPVIFYDNISEDKIREQVVKFHEQLQAFLVDSSYLCARGMLGLLTVDAPEVSKAIQRKHEEINDKFMEASNRLKAVAMDRIRKNEDLQKKFLALIKDPAEVVLFASLFKLDKQKNASSATRAELKAMTFTP